jgi:hypothetical protein
MGLRTNRQSKRVAIKVRAARHKSHQQLHTVEREIASIQVCQCDFSHIEENARGVDFCVRCGKDIEAAEPETEIDEEIDVGYTD